MSEDALRVATIVLGILGVIFLSTLLLTPAPKHAIVKAFVTVALARCVGTVVPPILFQIIPGKLADLPSHVMAKAFCIADAIIVRYLTITMAAFSLSFTLPLLYLSYKFSRKPDYAEYNYNQPFYRRTTGALVFGPFLWAFPIIFTPLPRLSHDFSAVKAVFEQATCIVEDPVSETLSLVLIIIPLVLAIATSVIFVFSLWRTIKLPLLTHNLGLLDVIDLLRFGLLLGIFLVSIILYSIITAAWVKWNVLPHVDGTRLHSLVSISVIWESVTPILFFCIFAAHEELFSVWLAWSRGFLHTNHQDQAQSSKEMNLEDENHHHPTDGWWQRNLNRMRGRRPSQSDPSLVQAYESPEAHFTAIPQRILLRPTLYHYSSSRIPVVEGPELPSSLLPPPRPVKSRSGSPDEPSPGLHTLVNMPSLTAFGGSESLASLPERPQTSGKLYMQSAKGSRPSTAGTLGSVDTDEYDDSRSFVSAQSYED